MNAMTKDDLIRFEKEVARRFEERKIQGPIHLSGGNEDELIEIFKKIKLEDWVFSTWRSHYHALLHGVPEELVMREIMQGKSMGLMFPEYHFLTSGIVGGILPIAVGVAFAGKRVHCFLGDMAERAGMFHECQQYAKGHDLPITFYIEDNGLSCNTPTPDTWGNGRTDNIKRYQYVRQYPHCGSGKWVNF